MDDSNTGATDDTKRLISRVFEEIWNQGNVQVANEIFAEGYIADPGNGDQMTTHSLRETVLNQRAISPQLHYVVNQFIVEGDLVATRWTGTGIRLDGATVSRWGMTMWRISNSRITEAWVLTSTASPLHL
jgi:predicted ester cyclase